MEKAKKNSTPYMKGTCTLIARKLGCHPKYVGRVLNHKLGKYNSRNTELVKKIHKTAAEIEKMFTPGEQSQDR